MTSKQRALAVLRLSRAFRGLRRTATSIPVHLRPLMVFVEEAGLQQGLNSTSAAQTRESWPCSSAATKPRFPP